MKLYEILGVHVDADFDTIKSAYRKLAQKHHPDKGGVRVTFDAIQHAYEVLSDPERRARYNETGDTSVAPDRAAMVNQALADMLLSLLEHVEDVETFDILGKLRLHIGGLLNDVAAKREKLNAMIEKREEAKRRLKLREGTVNIAAGIIDAANRKDQAIIPQLEARSRLLMDVQNVLNKYDYEWESKQGNQEAFFHVFNGQIFTR